MLKKLVKLTGIFLSLFLIWFAIYQYREAGPIAEENLRGLALSIASAVESLAVHDPSLAALAKYHPREVAYLGLLDSRGVYRFHSNPDLIGTPFQKDGAAPDPSMTSPSESRITLGTGERAFLFTTPIYLRGQTLFLRLTLHTYRADAVLRRAKQTTTVLLALLLGGWGLTAALVRFARREELHRLEMAKKESLAKLGEMGAMLAHEIRNPLSGIKGYAQVIAKRPSEPRNSTFAQSIVTEAVRLENLVNGLLAYAATDPPMAACFDLAELLDEIVLLLAPEAHEHGVEVVRKYRGPIGIRGNRDRLEQALLNLGKNALQAMPEGGVVSFTLAICGDEMVRVAVSDSGEGIPEENFRRVFDPFFTTKARGTGLGLALCKKIVDEHQGAIELKSAVGEGTTVSIYLPLVRSGFDAQESIYEE